MTTNDVTGPDEQIIEENVDSLIRIIENSNAEEDLYSKHLSRNSGMKKIGDYVFLIGAGTSKPEPADIPTAGELIEKWRNESYQDRDEAVIQTQIAESIEEGESKLDSFLEQNDLDDIEPEEAFDEATADVRRELFVVSEEQNMQEYENEYGFWFQNRYGNQSARREFIRELVEDRDPPFGMVALGILMEENLVPITLTPNFDDLLFDAFYLFLDQKPQTINYDAIASQFKVTSDRPTIVKLHGDHLNYNLRNTGPETFELSENIEEALSRTLREYGLVVIGYGGEDESIMGVLEDLPVPTQGIYWCARNRDELSKRAKDLLEQPNTFYVDIEGSDEFFTKLLSNISRLSLPIPNDIEELGTERADTYDKIVKLQKEDVEGRSREIFDEYEVLSEIHELEEDEQYEEAIDKLDELVEYGHRSVKVFHQRGELNLKKEEYEKAIEDYNQALQISERPTILNSRAVAKIRDGETEDAILDFERIQDMRDEPSSPNLSNLSEAYIIEGSYDNAISLAEEGYELSEENEEIEYKALCLMFISIAKIASDQDVSEYKEELREVASSDFITTWSFKELDKWVEELEMDDGKKDKINELIDILRDHEE